VVSRRGDLLLKVVGNAAKRGKAGTSGGGRAEGEEAGGGEREDSINGSKIMRKESAPQSGLREGEGGVRGGGGVYADQAHEKATLHVRQQALRHLEQTAKKRGKGCEKERGGTVHTAKGSSVTKKR